MRVLCRPRLADLPQLRLLRRRAPRAPTLGQSDLFTEREKLALDYAVAVMRTPVEITALLALVNLDRFNAAIGSAGFSEGMVCVAPDRPATNSALAPLAY